MAEDRDVEVDSTALQQRLERVRAGVAEAATSAGRDPAEVTTIVVTKFQPPELVEALARLGVRDFGESRHPEARDKAAALAGSALHEAATPASAPTWHFIGQLQTKKARQIARYADVVHSVDRAALIDALSTAERHPAVFLQIDLADRTDPRGVVGRGGADPADAAQLTEHILAAGLRLAGVMAVAPQDADPRAAFDRLREVSDRVRRIAPVATAISAGMSGDFAAAIAAGATHLRIGTAITGPRPPAP